MITITKKKSHPYILLFLFIFFLISGLITTFWYYQHKKNSSEINKNFTRETEKIERTFISIIERSTFLLSTTINQIKESPQDVQHIIKNSQPHNVSLWDTLSWLDNSHPSTKEHLQQAQQLPGNVFIGSPTFSPTTQRFILPLTTGVSSNNEHLGSLTLSIDMLNLSATLSNVIKEEALHFALLDTNLEPILQSPNNFLEDNTDPISTLDLQNFIEDHNIPFNNLSAISHISPIKGTNHYLHKMKDYPFVIYAHYNKHFLFQSFWHNIIYRVTEIFCIFLISLLIVFYIYKRERSLRDHAELSKQKAIEATQEKVDFLAYTAHELRSPLGFIMSSTELMMMKVFGPINEKYLEYVTNMHRSSKELLEFIEDLLVNMKLEKSGFRIEESAVDITQLINRATKVNNLIYNNKITIETHHDKKLPLVLSDPKRLFQIFNNIISNSIKYSPEDSLLQIQTKMYNGSLKISFKDQGYGMTKEELTRATNKYASQKKKSIGLGLSLVKDLLELMEIKFMMKSKLGSGTHIVLLIPKEKLHQPQPLKENVA